MDSVKADHGFSNESRAFKNLLWVMSEFNVEERRQFLQFITGSPKLPIGGKGIANCCHFRPPLSGLVDVNELFLCFCVISDRFQESASSFYGCVQAI